MLRRHPRGLRLDRQPQFQKLAQVMTAVGTVDAPGDDVRVDGVPRFGRKRPGANARARGDHPLGLQDPQGLPDHGAGGGEPAAEVLGDERLLGPEDSFDDEPAQFVDDAGVQVAPGAARHRARITRAGRRGAPRCGVAAAPRR